MQDLREKVAVVTGGASGIGRAMALTFANEGMNIAIADIEDEPSAKVRQEIEAIGVKAAAFHTDVRDRKAVDALADQTYSEFGGAHIICNNAGVGAGGPLDHVSDDDWNWVLQVNLYGVVNGLQSFIPRLKEQGQGGHIVNTASMAGMVALAGLGVYNATKFAVVGISETLRQDLEPYDIGVSVLCPGWVRTSIAESQRNRPADMDEGFQDEALSAEIRTLVEDQGIDPMVVGEDVLRAVRNNELYIFTHPDWQFMVMERFEAINAAFATAAAARGDG